MLPNMSFGFYYSALYFLLGSLKGHVAFAWNEAATLAIDDNAEFSRPFEKQFACR